VGRLLRCAPHNSNVRTQKMIYAEPTKKGVGVSLCGDTLDLWSLHSTIHDLMSTSPHNEDFTNTILGLAYDVRHAYQGDRETITREIGPDSFVTYFKFNVPWTYILFVVRYLRECVGYSDCNKEHQSNIYRLEHEIEKALVEYDEKVGRSAIEEYKRLSWFSSEYLPNFVSECTNEYMHGGASGKMRFRRLPFTIRMLDERSPEYKAYHNQVLDEARKQNVHPSQVFDTREWPEMEW